MLPYEEQNVLKTSIHQWQNNNHDHGHKAEPQYLRYSIFLQQVSRAVAAIQDDHLAEDVVSQ